MIRIIHMSDIHFGREDVRAITQAQDYIQAANADAIIVSGDLTQFGKRDEFEAAWQWLDQFKAPTIVVAGNHDTPMLNLIERVQDPFGRFQKMFGKKACELTIEDVGLFGLNTSRGWQTRANWAEGSVDLADLDKIIDEAGEPGRGPVNGLVCHHPFRSVPDAPLQTSTRRGMRASERLAASPINVLLTGHVHKPSAHVIQEATGRYLAISAGTLSTRLRDSPPSLNDISIDGSRIVVRAINFRDEKTEIVLMGQWDLNHLEAEAA